MSDALAHAAGGHAAHHPALQHHFSTMEQQKEAGTLGMWVFLLTEVLFFGGLFMAYTLYRVWYFDAFAAASTSLGLGLGTLNTAVLIGSSLTMAFAVRSAQTGKQRAIVGWLLMTILLGLVFLGIKAIEYKEKFDHHHVPGPHFVWAEPGHEGAAAAGEAPIGEAAAGEHADQTAAAVAAAADQDLQLKTQLFFSLYFTMTGLHALHMIIGVGIICVIAWMAHKGKFDEHYYAPVEMTGLYWHFVDIVWIYLFPLLYLVERHH